MLVVFRVLWYIPTYLTTLDERPSAESEVESTDPPIPACHEWVPPHDRASIARCITCTTARALKHCANTYSLLFG